jgi:hypothetical protein
MVDVSLPDIPRAIDFGVGSIYGWETCSCYLVCNIHELMTRNSIDSHLLQPIPIVGVLALRGSCYHAISWRGARLPVRGERNVCTSSGLGTHVTEVSASFIAVSLTLLRHLHGLNGEDSPPSPKSVTFIIPCS